MLTVAAVNAIEPLIIKWVFDELTAAQRESVLVLSIAALAGFALLREAMDNCAVSAELYPGPWTDAGTPERLAELDQA